MLSSKCGVALYDDVRLKLRLSGWNIAIGLRRDVIIWCQCSKPRPSVRLPTMTCPIGSARRPSAVASTFITVSLTWIELRRKGGTENIMASLKMIFLAPRLVLVRFFVTFLSFLSKYTWGRYEGEKRLLKIWRKKIDWTYESLSLHKRDWMWRKLWDFSIGFFFSSSLRCEEGWKVKFMKFCRREKF